MIKLTIDQIYTNFASMLPPMCELAPLWQVQHPIPQKHCSVNTVISNSSILLRDSVLLRQKNLPTMHCKLQYKSRFHKYSGLLLEIGLNLTAITYRVHLQLSKVMKSDRFI